MIKFPFFIQKFSDWNDQLTKTIILKVMHADFGNLYWSLVKYLNFCVILDEYFAFTVV